LVQLPAGKRALQNKWVYKLKEEDGGEKQYKARLVVKGFAQNKGIDFDEIFSPVVKMTSIRTILSLLAVEYLHLGKVYILFHAGECRGGVPPLRGSGGPSPRMGGLGASRPPAGVRGRSP
jgi:hypothetical protein